MKYSWWIMHKLYESEKCAKYSSLHGIFSFDPGYINTPEFALLSMLLKNTTSFQISICYMKGGIIVTKVTSFLLFLQSDNRKVFWSICKLAHGFNHLVFMQKTTFSPKTLLWAQLQTKICQTLAWRSGSTSSWFITSAVTMPIQLQCSMLWSSCRWSL